MEALHSNRNEINREPMEAYMKNHFSFLGIKSPERKKILSPILKECRQISEVERLEIASSLYDRHEREYHYAALALLEKGTKKASVSSIGFYKELVMTASWWDSVDMIASNLCGDYFKKYPQYLAPITEKWRVSSHLWVRRTSLLIQLKYKKDTNEELLFDTIDVLKHEREFFIEKAIGWALREYSKTNPEAVLNYIEKTGLRPLSQREGLKWLKNQAKITT
ncbi:DNA alkylation repair protein [Halobacillus yeomjeoni]|uniref:DNA alkylation repair protein n=1 Tax=Halobacillus yeomjeoni TaxID=311194 RepID=UPI001CD56068|nr:DNA alkylation repair protein [Halobacillus yeomjeoni]MCA0983667.1 DNA alkylation repair protein [Halobacillus yeomjeoni]